MLRSTPCMLLLVSLLNAQDVKTTADQVTELDRGLKRAITEVLLDGGGADGKAADRQEGAQVQHRTLFLLVDPTTSVWKTGLATRLEQAMAEVGDRLGDTWIGVRRIGDKKKQLLVPTKDRQVVVQGVRTALREQDSGFHDTYTEIRRLASRLANVEGRKEILLICFDNADVEGDVEKTVAQLRKSRVRLSVITREAYISDSYWEGRNRQATPAGTRLHPGDGAFLHLPWGWVFQRNVTNEIAPAGFAMYGMSRLAAGTGGRVYLYSPGASSKHDCGQSDSGMSCLFCAGEHHQDLEYTWVGRVDQLAPYVGARKDAYRNLAADPIYRAIDRAWRETSEARLIGSRPSISLGSGSATPQKHRARSIGPPMNSFKFKANAQKADKLRAKGMKILRDFNGRLTKAKQGRGSKRFEAAAAMTQFQLQLAIVNLVIYSAWCRELAPALLDEKAKQPVPPEIGRARVAGEESVWIYATNLSLCHGVKLFANVELPGGDLLRKEMAELDRLFVDIETRYGHTGYALGLHRAGIAQFHILFVGPRIVQKRPRTKTKSKKKKKTTTPPKPSRPVRGGSGSERTGSATTGGGR